MPGTPLHTRVERALQSGDMRLIYGVGIPLLLVVGLIAALAISGATWLVIPLIIVVVLLTAIVMLGFTQMLSDPDEGDEGEDRR